MNSKTQIIISMGTGGVGKTTVSAAIAIKEAMSSKKVLVITMDPSLRLATNLGIAKDGQSHCLKLDGIEGEVWASVINHKKTFDDFLSKAAQKNIDIEKIISNPLYQKLSTSLSGSQEFTAIERLLTEIESNAYDCIVLDTPPSQNAFDFLNAPQKLSMLFNDKIAQWFRGMDEEPSLLKKFLHQGTVQVLKVLELITGGKFISQLRDFFVNISSWQDKLNSRTIKLEQILKNPQTQFVVVTNPNAFKLSEALELIGDLKNKNYPVKKIVINKFFPHWLVNETEFQNEFSKNKYDDLFNFYLKQKEQLIERLKFDQMDLEKIFLPEYEFEIQTIEELQICAENFENILKD